ncbi:unnamed protein product [Rhizoctonia solani]|uniref:Lysine-specific metallo-endopeptidase domain-containing protein n=1 Tax=Rhizoctonia solani TaxID=456999 RepID=A0A8H3DGJ6_9AGAM|nr:unnamed protein product [Rhizoctonia solani]
MRAAFAIALASAALIGISAAPGLSLSLVAPESVTNVEDFTVTAIVKNTGTETLKLLKDPRSFTGMFLKYSPEAVVKKNNATSFTTLAPGQTFEITHSLAGIYNFTNTGAGDFKLDTVSNVFQYIDASGSLATIEASTESKKVGVTGKLVSTRGLPKVAARSLSKRVSYVGCSSSQQSQIASAVTAANNYVSAATSYLNGISSGTTRYTTWFGTYDSGRASTVRSHFSLIGTDASSVTYDCSTCSVDAMAYVYADEPSRIYFCGSYWSVPITGTDSKAGTIIHELSHFTVNGGTDDIAYGQTLAKNLAKSNPSQAIMNADSHEYFAENDPALA